MIGPVEAIRTEDCFVVVSALRACIHDVALAEAPFAFRGAADTGRRRRISFWRQDPLVHQVLDQVLPSWSGLTIATVATSLLKLDPHLLGLHNHNWPFRSIYSWYCVASMATLHLEQSPLFNAGAMTQLRQFAQTPVVQGLVYIDVLLVKLSFTPSASISHDLVASGNPYRVIEPAQLLSVEDFFVQ